MMPISRNRAITISMLVLIFLGGSLFHGQKAYAEMKQVFASSKNRILLSDDTYFDQVRVRVVNNHQIFSSSDPDWDKAKFFCSLYYINPTGQGDDFKGCFVITHQNRDQSFIKFEGSWKWKEPKDGWKWTAEIKGSFIGGTGKFEGIRGTVLIEQEGAGQQRLKTDWEIKYELE